MFNSLCVDKMQVSKSALKVQKNKSFLATLLISVTLIITPPYSHAIDIVKVVAPQSGVGKSMAYKSEILSKALDITTAEFGPYVINSLPLTMNPQRAISEIQTGKLMNVAIIAANKEWDSRALPINIPIRGGTLSYRLLLVNKKNESAFSKVKTLNDLKRLTAGQQSFWTTTQLLRNTGSNVVSVLNVESLFEKLKYRHIDYIPRAIYEAFDELSIRSYLFDDLVIEPNLALYIPMVSYLYVSPSEPKLAERLRVGLTELAESGELKRTFNLYYQSDIARSNLAQRHIIEINNAYFSEDSLLTHQHVWKLH